MVKAVTVDFNANITRFTSSVDKATNDLARFQSNTTRISGNIDKTLSGLGNGLKTLGLGLAVSGFAYFIRNSIDAADRLNDLNKSTGIAVETLAGLGLAAQQSGGDLESTADAINKLSVNIGKDTEKFAKLGITAKDPLEAFKQLADIYVAIEDPQARAALAAAALGKSWQGAAPLLAEGSEKIQQMVDKGTKLSKVTKENVEQADKFNDKMAELTTRAQGYGLELGTKILPFMEKLLDYLDKGGEKSITFGERLRALVNLTPFGAPLAVISKFGGVEEGLTGGTQSQSGKIGGVSTPAKATDPALAKRICEFGGGTWDGTKCVEKPPKTTKTGSSTGGPNLVLENAKDTAELTLAIQKLQEGEKSEIQTLQDKLDAYSGMDPVLKAYNQSVLDTARVLEDAASFEEAFSKGLENEAEVFNEALEAERNWQEQSAANYTAMSDELSKINEDLNVELLTNDKDRVLAQLALENDRKVERIQNLMLEGDEVAELLSSQAEIYGKQVEQALKRTNSVGKELGLTFTSAFEDAVVGGNKFGDVLDSLAQDIEKLLIRRTVTEPLMKGVDSLLGNFDFGSILSALLNADGNAFGSQGVMKFAAGGIFDSATAFKFKNGSGFSNGILGEAGPEAILPLSRGSNGQLGVQMLNGGSQGTNVVVNLIESPGNGGQTKSKQEGGTLTIDIMVEKIEASMSKNIRAGRGIAPTIESQYGLNRAAGVY